MQHQDACELLYLIKNVLVALESGPHLTRELLKVQPRAKPQIWGRVESITLLSHRHDSAKRAKPQLCSSDGALFSVVVVEREAYEGRPVVQQPGD